MENSGVFNRQWRLRPVGPYNISAIPRPKLSQAHARLQGKKTKITRTLLTVVELSYEATIAVCLKVIVLQYFRC